MACHCYPTASAPNCILFEFYKNNDNHVRQCAILDYMHTMGYTQSLAIFRQDSGISEDMFEPGKDPKSKYAGLLEKKWTSVIRLQKKVCIHAKFVSIGV